MPVKRETKVRRRTAVRQETRRRQEAVDDHAFESTIGKLTYYLELLKAGISLPVPRLFMRDSDKQNR